MLHYFRFRSKTHNILARGHGCWGSMWEAWHSQSKAAIEGDTLFVAIHSDWHVPCEDVPGIMRGAFVLELFEKIFSAFGTMEIDVKDPDIHYRGVRVTFTRTVPINLIVGLLQLIRTPIYLLETGSPKRPFAMLQDDMEALSHMGKHMSAVNALLAQNYAAYLMTDMFDSLDEQESDMMLPYWTRDDDDTGLEHMPLLVFHTMDDLVNLFANAGCREICLTLSRCQEDPEIYPHIAVSDHDVSGNKFSGKYRKILNMVNSKLGK